MGNLNCFGRKAEALSDLQRSLFEEDTDDDIAAAQVQLENLLPKGRSDEAEERSNTDPQTTGSTPSSRRESNCTPLR